MQSTPSFQELIPFGENGFSFRCQALAHLDEHQLKVHFRLSGDVSAILLPPHNINPSRRDGLWEHTCFEFFLNPTGQDTYWELNFAPSGDWAAYRFTSYRAGMAVEERIQNVTIRIAKESTQYQEWQATLDLSGIAERNRHLICGLSCVIETNDKQKTYWALSHPATKPDFHSKESFKESLCN